MPSAEGMYLQTASNTHRVGLEHTCRQMLRWLSIGQLDAHNGKCSKSSKVLAWQQPGNTIQLRSCMLAAIVELFNAVAASCMSQLVAATRCVQRHSCWSRKPACSDQLRLCSVSKVQQAHERNYNNTGDTHKAYVNWEARVKHLLD